MYTCMYIYRKRKRVHTRRGIFTYVLFAFLTLKSNLFLNRNFDKLAFSFNFLSCKYVFFLFESNFPKQFTEDSHCFPVKVVKKNSIKDANDYLVLALECIVPLEQYSWCISIGCLVKCLLLLEKVPELMPKITLRVERY